MDSCTYRSNGTAQIVVGRTRTTPISSVTGTDSRSQSNTWTYGSAVAKGTQVYHNVVTVAGSGTTTLDLNSFTNAALETAQAFTKVKAIRFESIANTDLTTNSASVTIGAAGSNPFLCFMGGTTPTFKLYLGGCVEFKVGTRLLDSTGAAVTLADAGATVSATVKNLLFTNDTANKASILVTIFGV
jgi:hypothetical protein